MVTQSDAQASSCKKEKEQGHLERAEARIPEIRGRRGDAQEQSPDEEHAITPTDFRPWKSRHKVMHLIFGIRSGKKSRPFPTIGVSDLHSTDAPAGRSTGPELKPVQTARRIVDRLLNASNRFLGSHRPASVSSNRNKASRQMAKAKVSANTSVPCVASRSYRANHVLPGRLVPVSYTHLTLPTICSV